MERVTLYVSMGERGAMGNVCLVTFIESELWNLVFRKGREEETGNGGRSGSEYEI